MNTSLQTSTEHTVMKNLLATVFSSVSEIAAWMETDPAIVSVMPKEMTSCKAGSFERDNSTPNKIQ